MNVSIESKTDRNIANQNRKIAPASYSERWCVSVPCQSRKQGTIDDLFPDGDNSKISTATYTHTATPTPDSVSSSVENTESPLLAQHKKSSFNVDIEQNNYYGATCACEQSIDPPQLIWSSTFTLAQKWTSIVGLLLLITSPVVLYYTANIDKSIMILKKMFCHLKICNCAN